MCWWTEEEVVPTVGLPRHRHFVGFFNISRIQGHHFNSYSEKPYPLYRSEGFNKQPKDDPRGHL